MNGQPSPPAPSPDTGERERWHADNVPAARRLRREETPGEAVLWDALRNRRCLNLKFRRQHPVGKFVLDFYCELLRVAIEVDGSVHLEPGQKVKDIDRQTILEGVGIRFIRVPADLVTTERKPELMRYLTETLSIQAGTPLPLRERGRGEGQTHGSTH